MKHKTLTLALLIISLLLFSCSNDKQQTGSKTNNQLAVEQTQENRKTQSAENQGKLDQSTSANPAQTAMEQKIANPKITFVELGSVNCIPCKAMQPVMKSIEEKYGEQIHVIFYDVWTRKEQKYANQYGIRIIPTQVFLDENGREIMRHEGFFPETEIDAFLAEQGLKIKIQS